MKKQDRIIGKVNGDKAILKAIEKESYYSVEQLISDGQQYIKAIQDGRMINSIGSVSTSGMSRTIKFLSAERNTKTRKYYYRQYWVFFKVLGYSPARNSNDYFSVSGCGMDMIFHTNYSIIHKLTNLGFLSKKQCSILAQQTPTTI